MMSEIIWWPTRLEYHASNAWNLAGAVVQSGQSASGEFSSIRFDGGGRWVAKVTGVVLRSREDVLSYRAIRMALKNGVALLSLPRDSSCSTPWPTNKVIGGVLSQHSDGSPHSDGGRYYQPNVVALTPSDLQARGTQITIRIINGAPLIGGEAFSIRHPTQGDRMYEIMRVSTEGITAGDYFCTIEPPLRDVVYPGTDIEFDRPRCLMALEKPDGADFTMKTLPHDAPDLSFVERLIVT